MLAAAFLIKKNTNKILKMVNTFDMCTLCVCANGKRTTLLGFYYLQQQSNGNLPFLKMKKLIQLD